MAKKIKEKYKIKREYLVKNALVNYFIVIMFTVFPLFYTQQYSEIRHDKLYFFTYTGLGLIFVEGIILLCSIFSDNKQELYNEKKWYKKLSVTDYAFGVFVLSCGISTLLSPHRADAISGNSGRNNGLLLMCIYFGVYTVISRLFFFKRYILPLFALGSTVVFILCILHFYYIDPLGLYNNYGENVIMNFTSTIGNRNYMSCFCCIAVPVLLMLYIHIENALRYMYLISAGIGFSAMICSNSESGFLGIIPTLAIIFIYTTKDYDKMLGFFSGVGVMLIFGKALAILNMTQLVMKKYGSIQSFFVDSNIIYVLIGFCAIACVGIIFLKRKFCLPPKLLFYISLSLFLSGIIFIVGSILYFTFIDTKTSLNSITSYFRFNEKWGTHRGYFWIKSFEIFSHGSFAQKLFGTGPDTFYFAFSQYFPELSRKFGESSTNCAHNEFINYLITIGIVGTVSYIALTVSVIVRGIKNAKNNYLSIVFAVAIICYLFQSTVNIAQPVTTPLIIIFIALTEAVSREQLMN